MKTMMLVILALSSFAVAQVQKYAPKKIALTPNSTFTSREVLETLNWLPNRKYCANVVLTNNASKADYMVEIGSRVNIGISATLFSLSGYVLFQTRPRVYNTSISLYQAVRDVCTAVHADLQKTKPSA